jgi:hypothetical protein
LLALAFSFFTAAAYPDTLLRWEFSGQLTATTPFYGVDARYPVGTPFSLTVTIDPTAPKIGLGYDHAQPRGVYSPIGDAALRLGDDTFSKTGGFLTVNRAFGLDCFGASPGWVEYWMIFGWSPAMNTAFPAVISMLDLSYFDPTVAGNGAIPIVPPTGPVGVLVSLNGDPRSNVVIRANVDSVSAIQDVAVPEPGRFLLLATGLAGLYTRRRVVRLIRVRHATLER